MVLTAGPGRSPLTNTRHAPYPKLVTVAACLPRDNQGEETVQREEQPVPADSPKTLARLSSSEWTIECGQPQCGTILADAAWIDINFNMALNGADAGGAAADLSNLPSPHLRRYRLGVMFPFDWIWSESTQTWQVEGARAEHRTSSVIESTRVVRGNWSISTLGQLGAPPFRILCFGCHTLQTVSPLRRKGTPPIPKAEAVDPAQALSAPAGRGQGERPGGSRGSSPEHPAVHQAFPPRRLYPR